jgi:hypothetical protein
MRQGGGPRGKEEKMGFTDYPNGVTSYGIPVLAAPATYPIPTGKVLWVCNTSGTNWKTGVDTDPGGSREFPFATLAYALTKCVAGDGDFIYVLPGHTESITAAGTITMDKALVTVIGLGRATERPAFTFTTATTATFLVTGSCCAVYNCYFDCTGVNALVKPFDIQAAGFRMQDCEVYFAKTSYVALKVMSTISTTAADRLTLINNYIHGDAVASTTEAIRLLGGDSMKFSGNRIVGNFTTTLGCINNVTVTCTNITIDSNWLENRTAVAQKVVVLLTGDTGVISNNRMLNASVTAPVTTAGCLLAGNYWASGGNTLASLY